MRKSYNNNPIMMQDIPIAPSNKIRSLGVTIDHCHSVKAHAARGSSRLRANTGRLWDI